jgi:hypothetical protein
VRWVAGFVSALLIASGVALTHCGDEDAASEPPIGLPDRDSSDPADGDPGDAAVPGCDREKPFGTPALVAGLDGSVFAAAPRLSPDELVIYFTTLTTIDGSVTGDLMRAKRASRDAPFEPATLIASLNSPEHDNDPTVASDDLSLWFSSSRSGNNEIWVATRASPAADFASPTLVPGVGGPTSEMHAFYRAAGSELWLTSDRSEAGIDIYVAKKEDGSFSTPVLVPALSTPAFDVQPALTEDGLLVVLASTRDGGAGGFDLWLARRTSTNESFQAPTPIKEVNSAADEYAGWLSADGCRIYFSSNRDVDGGAHRLFRAERPR